MGVRIYVEFMYDVYPVEVVVQRDLLSAKFEPPLSLLPLIPSKTHPLVRGLTVFSHILESLCSRFLSGTKLATVLF